MTCDEIVAELTDYIGKNYPASRKLNPFPVSESLYRLGILDSFGIVELVAFIEARWGTKIDDSEITAEKFDSLQNISKLVASKVGK